MSSFLKLIDIGLQSLLYSKFNSILDLDSINADVIRWPKDIALREHSEKEGAVDLEFISLWRTRTAPSWQRQNTAVGRRGLALAYTDSTQTEIVNAKAMPVDLEYEVSFWTSRKEKINEITETYLFWQQTDPNLYLNYLDTYPAELDLHFGELIDDSTVREKYQKGTIWCMNVPIKVDGWVFTSENIKTVQTIEITLYDGDSLESPYTELYDTGDSFYDSELSAILKISTQEITE